MIRKQQIKLLVILSFFALSLNATDVADLRYDASGATVKTAPFKYVWGKAYHVLPETHNRESGYFSLCEGLNGRMYIGTSKYGENAYLVEFDPVNERQRIVIDTHRLCGLGITGELEAQSKIHTRNFVGPSGKIYVGSMEGFADTLGYPGGYLMTYNPATGETENLGIPQPGIGIIDVVADEAHGIIYVIPRDGLGPWTLYDMKSKQYRVIGPVMTGRAHTLIDWRGYANAITKDNRLAQYNPDSRKLVVRDILVDGEKVTNLGISPEWSLAADGRTAYLVQAMDPILYEIPLQSDGEIFKAKSHGRLLEGKNPRCRTLRLGPDGCFYAVVRVRNETGFGKDKLYHLVRFNANTDKIDDMGVLAVENPDFFFNSPNAVRSQSAIRQDESNTYVGYYTLPDGTLTPGNSSDCMAMSVTRDGTIYVTILYPFTLLKITEAITVPSAK